MNPEQFKEWSKGKSAEEIKKAEQQMKCYRCAEGADEKCDSYKPSGEDNKECLSHAELNAEILKIVKNQIEVPDSFLEIFLEEEMLNLYHGKEVPNKFLADAVKQDDEEYVAKKKKEVDDDFKRMREESVKRANRESAAKLKLLNKCYYECDGTNYACNNFAGEEKTCVNKQMVLKDVDRILAKEGYVTFGAVNDFVNNDLRVHGRIRCKAHPESESKEARVGYATADALKDILEEQIRWQKNHKGVVDPFLIDRYLECKAYLKAKRPENNE